MPLHVTILYYVHVSDRMTQIKSEPLNRNITASEAPNWMKFSEICLNSSVLNYSGFTFSLALFPFKFFFCLFWNRGPCGSYQKTQSLIFLFAALTMLLIFPRTLQLLPLSNKVIYAFYKVLKTKHFLHLLLSIFLKFKWKTYIIETVTLSFEFSFILKKNYSFWNWVKFADTRDSVETKSLPKAGFTIATKA